MADTVLPSTASAPAKSSKPPRRTIVGTDIDPQGNVTVWDHGPGASKPLVQAPGETDDSFKARSETAKKEAEAWAKAHPAPVSLVMHSGEAAHALSADDRFGMEPADLDEAEVEAEVKKIQDARAAVAAAGQNAIDRKTAIATVMAARHAKANAEKEKAKE